MFLFKINRKDILKKILFVIFLTGLSTCIWNNYDAFFEIEKLSGSYKKTELLPLDVQTWLTSDYQHSVEEYFILNNSLSPFFIRIKNQVEYTLFDKVNISGGILGKDNYLYENVYIDSYYGRDFLGEQKLRSYVEKIKFVQDTLRKLNKEFIYIQCPGKASFFPEYIPDSLKGVVSDLNNYSILVKLLKEYNVNFIDFRPYFLKNKDHSPYPLFTHTGIHWSKYACYKVTDSINNYIENLLKIDLPEFYYNDIETDYARNEDDDLEHTMNLLFRVSDMKYGYPIIEKESPEKKDLPMVFMMGDSYLGALYSAVDFFEYFNPKSQYWYYNLYVYSLSRPERMHHYQLDQNQIIAHSDIIILGCTEPNIMGTSWDFINDTYDYYKFGYKSLDNPKRKSFMANVDSCKSRLTSSQVEQAIEEVKDQHISIDSAKTVYAINKMQNAQF
jgi:hypothetical protein